MTVYNIYFQVIVSHTNFISNQIYIYLRILYLLNPYRIRYIFIESQILLWTFGTKSPNMLYKSKTHFAADYPHQRASLPGKRENSLADPVRSTHPTTYYDF